MNHVPTEIHDYNAKLNDREKYDLPLTSNARDLVDFDESRPMSTICKGCKRMLPMKMLINEICFFCEGTELGGR